MKILLAPGCSVTYFVALSVAVFETAICIWQSHHRKPEKIWNSLYINLGLKDSV